MQFSPIYTEVQFQWLVKNSGNPQINSAIYSEKERVKIIRIDSNFRFMPREFCVQVTIHIRSFLLMNICKLCIVYYVPLDRFNSFFSFSFFGHLAVNN